MIYKLVRYVPKEHELHIEPGDTVRYYPHYPATNVYMLGEVQRIVESFKGTYVVVKYSRQEALKNGVYGNYTTWLPMSTYGKTWVL